MAEIILWLVVGILVLNVLAALVVSFRRGGGDNWLLVILLASTSAAAVAAILAALTAVTRMADVALVFTGTAAVTAAIRLAAERRRPSPDEP